MNKIKELEDMIKESVDIETQRKMQNLLCEIAYRMDFLEGRVKDFERKTNEQSIEIEAKRDTINMLKGMISGIVDNI